MVVGTPGYPGERAVFLFGRGGNCNLFHFLALGSLGNCDQSPVVKDMDSSQLSGVHLQSRSVSSEN